MNGTPTHESLKTTFLRKAGTSRLFLFLAKLADNEGRRDLARLFREMSEAETMHCHGTMELLRPAGDPITGKPMSGWEAFLDNAMDAAKEEAGTLFPKFAEQARADNLPEAAEWFESLARAETNHADRLAKYKDSLNTD